MTEIKIDKDIPVPPKAHGRGAPSMLSPLDVGDSMFLERHISGVSALVTSHAKNAGKKFICRTVTENGIKGTRIWRIA